MHISVIFNRDNQVLLCGDQKWEVIPKTIILTGNPSPTNPKNNLAYDERNREIGDFPRSTIPLLSQMKSAHIGYFTPAKGLKEQGISQIGVVKLRWK